MHAQLVRRGLTWSVKYNVPADDARVIGRAQIWRSTKEHDKHAAERKLHEIMLDILAEVDRLRAAAGKHQRAAAPATSAELLDELAAILDAQRSTVTSTNERDGVDSRRELAVQKLEAFMESRSVDAVPRATTFRRALGVLGGSVPVFASRSVEKYIAALSERDPPVRPSTLASTTKALNAFVTWAGDPQLSEVTPQFVSKYASEALKGAPASRRWALSRLGSWWQWCINKGHTASASPFAGARKDIGRFRSKQWRAWTLEELAHIPKLLEVPPSTANRKPKLEWAPRLYAAAAVGLLTGCRIEEVAGLKVSDVHLDDRWLAVAGKKTLNTSGSSERQVPIPRGLEPLLRRLVTESTDGYLIAGLAAKGNDSRRSSGLAQRFSDWVTKWRTDKTMVFHGLRSTYTTRCEEAGVPQSTADLLTGHARQNLSYGLYSKGPGLEKLIEAVDKLDLPTFS